MGWVPFAKEKVKKQIEVYNDVDSYLVNFYRCIQNHLQEFKRQLEYIPLASDFFYDYKEQLNIRGLTHIQRTVRYFYLIKGKFILSYNDDEFIRELYKDYHIESVERKNLLSASGNSDVFGKVIIKNY